MKIIDQTPFFDKDGKINIMDEVKAIMKFGTSWIQDTRAQLVVVNTFERVLDKNHTLLRNITLPGSDVSIPLILIGPAGVFTMFVTNLRGMYRAKADEWGTISGNAFKMANPNLLTLAARMAHVTQVYLRRHGYEGLSTPEAVVLCADPGMHVDSVRPIVRVVQSDALERFAISIAQARAVITPETVYTIVNHLTNPLPTQAPQPGEAAVPPAGDRISTPPEEFPYYEPTFTKAGEEPKPVEAEPLGSSLGFDFQEEALPFNGTRPAGVEAGSSPMRSPEPVATRPESRIWKAMRGFSTRQWVLLAVIGVVELAILIILFFMVLQNFY